MSGHGIGPAALISFDGACPPVGSRTTLRAFAAALARRQELNGRPVPHCVIFKPDADGIDLKGWAQTLCSLSGRSTAHASAPLAVITALALLVAVLSETGAVCAQGCRVDFLSVVEDQYNMLSIPISFLLVYRMNRVAVRYYESRAAVGQSIAATRDLVGQALIYCSHDPTACCDICRWATALPIAARNYVRAQGVDAAELEGILVASEVAELGRARLQPLLCQHRIRLAMQRAMASKSGPGSQTATAEKQGMECNIRALNNAWGAMERIQNTPLPFAFVAHLRLVLVGFLLGIPFLYGGTLGWAMPPLVFALSFSLLGIESAAVACERPFGLGANHLPLDYFCGVVAANVAEILEIHLGCAEDPAPLAGQPDQEDVLGQSAQAGQRPDRAKAAPGRIAVGPCCLGCGR